MPVHDYDGHTNSATLVESKFFGGKLMNQLIMHIGHGKTGSSYLQSVLARNRDVLARHGWTYPVHASDALALHGKISSGNGAVIFEEDYSLSPRTIVSSESLFQQLVTDESFDAFKRRHPCSLEVVLFVRDVFECLVSTWGQAVKRGGQTADVNAFLRQFEDFYYHKILFWMDASEKFDFKLTIRNYSNHQIDLLETFIEAAFGAQAAGLLDDMDAGDPFKVNRSLTLAEYMLQREFNKYDPGSASYISDVLVNALPDIHAEFPFIEKDVYEHVADWAQPKVDAINDRMEQGEIIQLESYEQLVSVMTGAADASAESTVHFSPAQLECLVRSVAGQFSRAR